MRSLPIIVMTTVSCVALLLLVGCGGGGGGGGPNTATVSGTVKDINTGQGIPGVRVTIAGHTDTTNSSGEYAISDVPLGKQAITVSKSGYRIAGSLPSTINVAGKSVYVETIYMYRPAALPEAPQL